MAENMNFDDATKKELSQFIEREQTTQRLQASIHKFTGMCWDKCVPGTPSTRFSSNEGFCLANCVDRFLDSSLFMVKQIEQQRNSA